MNHTELGRRGEELACRYLEEKGYRILDRNYRYERAELDIVAYDEEGGRRPGGVIVFVEVKTRRGTGFGYPEEAVTEAKQKQILKAAEAYRYERQLERAPCRFDVVAIQWQPERHGIEHIEDAFDATGAT